MRSKESFRILSISSKIPSVGPFILDTHGLMLGGTLCVLGGLYSLGSQQFRVLCFLHID